MKTGRNSWQAPAREVPHGSMAVSPFPSAKTCFFRECLTLSILALSVEWSRDCAALKMEIVLRIMRFAHYA